MAAPPTSGPTSAQTLLKKRRVDHLEAAAADPDGAAAVVLGLACRVRIDEGEVLHREPRMVLVLAVVGGPHLVRVAGVHVEDARLVAAAERHQSAAVDDDLGAGVVEDLGRLRRA